MRNVATENDDSFCRAEAIYQDFCWHRSRCVRKGIEGPCEETLYECNRRYETNYVFMYVGLQHRIHIKCKLARLYTLQIQSSFVLSVSFSLSLSLSFSCSHFLSLYAGRPRSGSMVATGGCTGMSCQRHHLHRFVPFVLK